MTDCSHVASKSRRSHPKTLASIAESVQVYSCAARRAAMPKITCDSPGQFLTCVAKGRLPVFRSEAIKQVAVEALDEARNSGKFSIYAYVIMPDHFHLVTGGEVATSRTLRFINGICGRRIIDYLKKNEFISSLEKLRHSELGKKYCYSVWDHHPNAMLLTSEAMLMQKVTYLHCNPVRAKLVVRADLYRWSSIRYWRNCPDQNEPLRVDIERIDWRRSV